MKAKAILKAFLIATITALSVRLVLVEDYRIASDSMMPNLLKGDLILVSKSAYNLRLPFSSFELLRTGKPLRTEVVAFSVPDHGADTFIKRIIGVAGDRIEIKDGILLVNDKQAQYEPGKVSGETLEQVEDQNPYPILLGDKPLNYGPVDIPKDHFFVLGDNRADSVDSRLWGPIPYSCLKGRVALIWLSVGSKGLVRPDRWLSAIP